MDQLGLRQKLPELQSVLFFLYFLEGLLQLKQRQLHLRELVLEVQLGLCRLYLQQIQERQWLQLHLLPL